MSYKSNAAYDFSRFAPVEEPLEQEERKVQNPPAQKRKKQAAKKASVKPIAVIKGVVISLFVMLSLTSIIVGNIKIEQLSNQITSEQKQLDTEKSNAVSLNAKLEARMSMPKVVDYAENKLGLVKAQPCQIQYVQLTNKDRVEVNGNYSGIAGFFQNLFHTVLAYFN